MKQTAVKWLVDKLETEAITDNSFAQAHKVITLDIYLFNVLFEQAKAMEKEQMCSFAEFVATYPDKNKNINGEMLHAKSKYDGAERTVDLLEEYYEDNN